jgi:Aerobic-type carbon monoxide dehydrogenase, middle subunit CoxM/CutM homologs
VLISDVHFPKDLAEALDVQRKRPGILLFAGGTDILREQGSRGLSLPGEILCIHSIPELRRAGLTERFLEIGAAVTISEMLSLGEAALPPILAEAGRLVGTPAVRNLATIGGNLASRRRFMDCWAPLACLDALVELRDNGGSTWMNVCRLAGPNGRPAFPEGALLTRVRVPIARWDACLLRKVGSRDYPSPETAVFAFAARAEKGILEEARIIFAGETVLRSQALESSLIGRSLPLSAKERDSIAEGYRDEASRLPGGLGMQFAALVAGVLDMLSR